MAAKSSRRVGLEISNSAVRIAEVSTSGGRARLLNIGQVRLPARAVVDGAVVDAIAVGGAIERCIKEGGFSIKEVHLGVAGLRAITRELDMPEVPDNELDAAARLQVLDVIPFPADKTLLSARALEDVTAADGSRMRRVLLAAAHRDLVEPLLAVVSAAGLVPLSVDICSTALVRALHDPGTSSDGPEAIVSIGSALTTIVIHEDGVPHFVRTVALGGDTITAAIAGALDLPTDDAETIKRNLDRSGPHIRAAATAAHGAAASLLSEIQSSVDYYSTLPGRGEIRRVKLTGGGSRLAGLPERLQQQVHAEVVAGSALARVDATSIDMSPDDVVRRDPLVPTVIGLALADPPGVKALDLLPPEVIVARRQRRTERRVLAVAAAVVLGLAGLGTLRYSEVHNAEGQVAAEQQTAAQTQADITRQEGHAKTYDAITADEGSVGPILKDEVAWPTVLADLARATPPGGVVTSLSGSFAPPVTPTPAAASPAGAPATTSPPPVASAPASSKAQLETVTIANLNVSLSTNDGYAYFRSWLQAMSTSAYFRYLTFSGLTGTGNTVTWTAQLAVLGTIQSARISRFEVTSK
ncbi:MAG: type IV pilus assembly protein PilM [Acidimicrobiales bacterium]